MAVFAFYIGVVALDVAFAISLTPSRLRMWAALAAAVAGFVALWVHLPVVPWVPYIVAATYLGALINRRAEGTPQVVRQPRVPRL